MLERVDTICVTVKDLQASIRWYHEKLQFTLLHQGEQYAILGFGDHSAPFTIEEDADQRFFTFYDPDDNKMQACFY
ncbi:VOC family protein [Geomicrobium sp. JSM 1781026]|uniref:VOC family protein n=1 Tax=Geomicrobium sp. JSM 1781026 TaxID=3344580 RepID=UPI0035C268C0